MFHLLCLLNIHPLPRLWTLFSPQFYNKMLGPWKVCSAKDPYLLHVPIEEAWVSGTEDLECGKGPGAVPALRLFSPSVGY